MPINPGFFGINSFVFPTGTATDYPVVGDVRLGTVYDSGALTGNLVLPIPADVLLGVGYGTLGTQYVGTLVIPSITPTTDELLYDSPASVVAWLLVALNQGTSPLNNPLQNWPVYSTNEPSSPDNCITVFDTSGRDDGRIMQTGNRSEHPGVQIRVRSNDAQQGYLKARAICVAVDTGFYDFAVTVNTNEYVVHGIYRSSNVLALGKNLPNDKRSVFTINATLDLKLVVP